MTKSQKKGFDDLFLSLVITYMDQENILVVAKGGDTNPMVILFHLSQWTALAFSAQYTATPAYG